MVTDKEINEAGIHWVSLEQGICVKIVHAAAEIDRLGKLMSHFDEAFIAGAKWMQEKMKEEASSECHRVAKEHFENKVEQLKRIGKI